MNRICRARSWSARLKWETATLGLVPLGLAFFGIPALAQIVPDNTLGTESSQVTPNVNVRGLPAERIDGGAVRGSALFHSFSEFNVNDGQRVYFSNPSGIANIFSRVTGSNVSNILGRLGVDGAANLFVLNPNGILFGPNAQLDIQGSFFASTARSFHFANGSEFSATNPQTAPLLTMSVTPGVQYGTQQPGTTITNRGNLSVGQDLTLAAGNLDVQGQLQAGRDLTLLAQNTVKVRDTVTKPFLAQSGGNLTVQGNQGIDILALNHPTQIPFVSGGNLSLISDGIISGDARFSSGGSFSIKSVSGGLANFFSYYDPIISVNGDVDVAANYEGTSLLVEATGNIRFGGDITITGPDTSALPAGPDTATLSSGSALIMRSGQSILAYGGVNSGAVPNYGTGNVPTGITLGGDVILQPFNGVGGTVKLLTVSGDVSTKLISTNGQRDDRFWSENANGGNISLTSITGSITTGDLFSYSSSSSANNGNGGAITLSTTNGYIETGNLYSSSYSSFGNSGNGGAITLSTTNGYISTGSLDSRSQSQSYSNPGNSGNGGAITLSTTNGYISTDTLYSTSSTRSDSNLPSGNSGNGGAITLSTTNGEISTGTLYSQSRSSSKSSGDGGTITISTTNGEITTQSLYSDSSPGSGKGGNGGAITLSTTGSDVSTGVLSSSTSSYNGNTGNGGAITVSTTNGNISLLGWVDSLSYSYSGNSGNGGAITISTINGNISLMSSLDSYSYSSSGNSGDGGAITISNTNGNIARKDVNSFSYSSSGNSGTGGTIYLSARDGDILGNKVLTYVYVGNNYVIQERNPFLNSFSVSEQGSGGNGGKVTLKAKNNVSNLDILTLSSFANAKAGDVLVEGFGNLSLTDTNILTSGQLKLQIQGQEITLDVGKAGQSGDVTVNNLGNLTFNNSRIASDTKGSVSAGNVTIASPGLIIFNNSQIISNTNSTGQAGSISVYAPEIRFDSGSTLSAKTSSSGRAGDVNLQPYAGGQTLSVFFQDGAEISASSTNTGLGGNIRVTAPQSVTLSGNGKLSSETSGSGQAGNIEITTPTLDVNGEAKVSTTTTKSATVTGTGGDISVKANTLNLSGANSGLFAETRGVANAGNLTLNPYSGNDLQVNFAGGAKVSASTSGSGQGGSLKVTAPNSVMLRGNGQLSAEATQGGNAGGVTINTQQLSIGQGAQVAASSKNGSGTAGDVDITASTVTLNNGEITAETDAGGSAEDSANITLRNLNTLNLSNHSSISASTQTGQAGSVNLNPGENPAASVTLNNSRISAQATEQGGNANGVTLNTSQLSLENGAEILASNVNSNKAGDITLQGLKTLQVIDSLISTSTASGTAGSVTVKASESVNLSGTGMFTLPGEKEKVSQGGVLAQATQGGNAGNINITTRHLSIEDGAQATVSSPQGQAGNLSIAANTLSLNRGEITAETGKKSDRGGANINLQLTDLLLLRNQSLISATASGDANGGNITISAPFVIAVPSENSDIIANAVNGDGGQINITANRIFGLKQQNGQSLDTLRGNRTSDISASSDFGLQGNINIQALSIDPSQGLTALPIDLIDPSNQITKSCGVSADRENQFVVTGRGGLPPSPDDLQTSGAITPGWVTREATRTSRVQPSVKPPTPTATTPQVEAEVMILSAQGNLVLPPESASATSHPSGFPEMLCSPTKN